MPQLIFVIKIKKKFHQVHSPSNILELTAFRLFMLGIWIKEFQDLK